MFTRFMRRIYEDVRNYMTKNYFIFILTLFLIPIYFYKLDTIPFAMQGDEAETALQGLSILENKISIIGVGWSDLPLLSFFPHAISMLLFGPSLIGHRIGSSVFGLLAVIIFYLICNHLVSRKLAIFGAVFLGMSHIWVGFSRLGLTSIQAAFIVLVSFYFAILGVKSQKKRYFVLTGIFLGLSVYSYYGARLAPLIVLPYIVLFLFNKRKIMISSLLISIFCAAIVALPQIYFYIHNAKTFSSRANNVFIFSDADAIREWRNGRYVDKGTFYMLKDQFLQTINIFAGEANGRHYGYRGQLFDWATIGLFFVGILALLRYSKKIFCIIFLWFSLMFFTSLLTASPIAFSRLVIGLPTIYFFSAFGAVTLFDMKTLYKRFTKEIIVIVALYIIFSNMFIYFVNYSTQSLNGIAGDSNALNATKIAYYLDQLPNSNTAIFLTAPNLYADFSTLKFLAPQTKRVFLDDSEDYWINTLCPRNISYISYDVKLDILTKIQKKCPIGSKLNPFKDLNGNNRFYILQY